MQNKYLPQNMNVREAVESGYKKIAFGDISDAVLLAFSDGESGEDFSKLDLFTVSELKRPKGGGLEVKFFDRIKALQCLGELAAEETDDTSFFEALEKSAQIWNGGEDTPDEA